MRTTRVWRRVLGVEHTVIESVELETDGRGQELLVARVRVKAGAARRCSRCQRRCPGYDTSPAPRRWRSLDVGTTQVYLQATTSRVACAEHGVVVAAVPWARPGSRFTTAFEDTAAWLVCHATLPVRQQTTPAEGKTTVERGYYRIAAVSHRDAAVATSRSVSRGSTSWTMTIPSFGRLSGRRSPAPYSRATMARYGGMGLAVGAGKREWRAA